MMSDKIFEIATLVRMVMESEEVRKSYVGFEYFPEGACMDASIILGRILEPHELGKFYYTSACNENDKTHSWLENETIVIDITADQFDSNHPTVLITDKKPGQSHLGFRKAAADMPIDKAEMSHFIIAFLLVEDEVNLELNSDKS